MGRGNEVAELMQVLARIADPTGGRALQSTTVDRLRDTFREVIEELAHQYMLAFVPETAGQKPGVFRRIRVEVETKHRTGDVLARAQRLPIERGQVRDRMAAIDANVCGSRLK